MNILSMKGVVILVGSLNYCWCEYIYIYIYIF